MRAHEESEHLKLLGLEAKRGSPREDYWMEHVLFRDGPFIAKVLHFDRNSFNLVYQHVFTDQPRIPMPLNLQLELIKVDMLKVEIVFPFEHTKLLCAQLG